jgi:hypothetical protein
VAYATSIERLLLVLHTRAPEKVDALAHEKRRVRHGLLSVGLKLHCLGEEYLFAPLIEALGGERWVFDRNFYKRSPAKFCLVLPPVANAKAAILLLECLEEYTRCRMFNNPNIQLQVCSPGRLTARNAALHAMGFYLSSDTLRQYALEDFATTVSDDHYYRGRRIVIHDAGPNGEFDSSFSWWARKSGRLAIRRSLPFLNARTDVLVGPGSRVDIHNINLLATLLVHAQSSGDGYWSSLGEQFADELALLLDRHLLSGLIEAPWIGSPDTDANPATDHLFLSALRELTAYAAAEATRLKRVPESMLTRSSGLPESVAVGGILNEMQQLLAKYRGAVTSLSEPEDADPP